MVQKEVEIENYGGVFEMRDFEGFFSEVLILLIIGIGWLNSTHHLKRVT